MNRIKQEWLAEKLGVTQAAISRWEAGADRPRTAHMGKLVDLIEVTLAGPLDIERRFIEAQPGVASLVRYDGMRMLAVSPGFRKLWPRFTQLIGQNIVDHLVDEAALITQQTDFRSGIREGTIALISGVSDRHTNVLADSFVRHRWHACLRKQGPLVTISMSYDLCDAATPTGVTQVINLDTFAQD